jgi:hypothetical protein
VRGPQGRPQANQTRVNKPENDDPSIVEPNRNRDDNGLGLALIVRSGGSGDLSEQQQGFCNAMLRECAVFQRRLAEAEEQIASGLRHIARQREVIAELESNGHPTGHAKYLLAGLELLQAARRDSRAWLLKQLSKTPGNRTKFLNRIGGDES